MKTSLHIVALLLLLWFARSLGATEPGQSAELSLEFRNVGEYYTVAARNVSGRTVSLPKMYLANPEKTGYWLFLYNPRTKEIEYAWSSGIGSPKMLSSDLERFPVKPGMVVRQKFDVPYIHGLFQNFSERGCYYLLVKYRKRYGAELIESPPSAPVRVCQ